MTTVTPDLDRLAIDTIRTLSIDGVQQANSGHPGAPMGAAPMAYVALDALPAPRADATRLAGSRPVRAVGRARQHAAVLAAPPDRLRRLARRPQVVPPVGQPDAGPSRVRPDARRRGDDRSARPGLRQRGRHGHRRAPAGGRVQPRRPRHRRPLDLRHRVRRRPPGGHRVGGRSLAGHLRLGKLIVLYDDNHIQLDGPTAMAWSEDVVARFEAYGWDTRRVEDGNDVGAIEAAIEAARADDRPSLIAVRTHIGFGSPNKQDSQKAHGAPLGPDEVRLTKEAYGWDPGRDVLRPGRGARAASARRSPTASASSPTGRTRFDGLRRGPPGRSPPSSGAGSRGELADGLGRGPQELRDRLGGRDAQRQPGRDPGPGGARARAVRRRRRPVRVEPDRRQGRGELQRRRGRPEPALRRPRARDGRRSPTGSRTTAGSSRTWRRS